MVNSQVGLNLQLGFSQQLNVLMFGLEGAGKTKLMYSGLIHNHSLPQPLNQTIGFNCEWIVAARESFNLWDISGKRELLELWPLFYKNIATEVVIFVIRANQEIEGIRDSKLKLHELCRQNALLDCNIFVILNQAVLDKQTEGVSSDEQTNSEQLLSFEMLKKVLKIEKLAQASKGKVDVQEFDVSNRKSVELLFDQISTILKQN